MRQLVNTELRRPQNSKCLPAKMQKMPIKSFQLHSSVLQSVGMLAVDFRDLSKLTKTLAW